jgi:hypothetical protein
MPKKINKARIVPPSVAEIDIPEFSREEELC